MWLDRASQHHICDDLDRKDRKKKKKRGKRGVKDFHLQWRMDIGQQRAATDGCSSVFHHGPALTPLSAAEVPQRTLWGGLFSSIIGEVIDTTSADERLYVCYDCGLHYKAFGSHILLQWCKGCFFSLSGLLYLMWTFIFIFRWVWSWWLQRAEVP